MTIDFSGLLKTPQYVIDFGKGYNDGFFQTARGIALEKTGNQDYKNGYQCGVHDKLQGAPFQPEIWWHFTKSDGEEWDNRHKVSTGD